MLIGQVGQNRGIDVVLGKALRVLGHAELFEPVRNLLHCGPSSGGLFCARQPSECSGPTTVPGELVLSWGAWMDLVRINTWVNETIKPLTDIEHWGVVDRWSYPDDCYGDCEDYVLLKRRMLIQYGWPREALLVTVVHNEKDEGHAVLTVTTDKGDYILDNRTRTSCSGQRPAINS